MQGFAPIQLEPFTDGCQSAQLTHLWGNGVLLVPAWGRATVGMRNQPARPDKHVGHMSLSVESGWGQGCGLKMITKLHKSECSRCSQTSLESLWIWVVHTNKWALAACTRRGRSLRHSSLKDGWAASIGAGTRWRWLKQAVPPEREKAEWL